ncbi:MAG: hypothetical protein Q7K25_01275, partial [Actinomycetota bacterium]|nr:hypothetical protein [Actinomycetota bacterium]
MVMRTARTVGSAAFLALLETTTKNFSVSKGGTTAAYTRPRISGQGALIARQPNWGTFDALM